MSTAEEIKQKKFRSEFSKVIINLTYTSSWLNQKYVDFLKPFGLTTPQFNILCILRGQHPDPSTVNLLIERMLDKSCNASRIVDKLEEKSLVIRRKCNKDRRAVDVLISYAGLELFTKLDQEIDELEKNIKSLTDEESKVLNDLLDKLRRS